MKGTHNHEISTTKGTKKRLYMKLFAATKSYIEDPNECWDICRAVPVFNVIDKHNNLVPWRGLHQALSHFDDLRKEVSLEGRWSTWETAEHHEQQTIGIGREQADWGETTGKNSSTIQIGLLNDRHRFKTSQSLYKLEVRPNGLVTLLNIDNNIHWFCTRI